ncbi:hypothetical protein L6R52_06610 [Myxococcota bacterium]|nr:hypothetical protein [Myxococcota bacterium]
MTSVPPGKVTVLRCPRCGSTDAIWDEPRSILEFTYMHCNTCGEGGLCDSWERDFDWYVEIELPEGAPIPERVAPLPPHHWFHARTTHEDAPAVAPAALASAAPPSPAIVASPAPPSPAIVASLAAESRGFGCARCWGDDAPAAWTELDGVRGRALVGEDHFGVDVKQHACGQRFAVVFTERRNWTSDDDQTWTIVPITPEDDAALTTCPTGQVARTLVALAAARRFLVCTAPLRTPPEAWWRPSGFVIGPHD